MSNDGSSSCPPLVSPSESSEDLPQQICPPGICPPGIFAAGGLVHIVGLQVRVDLNGQSGKLVEYVAEKSRWAVLVSGTSTPVGVQVANLRLDLNDSSSESDA